MANQVFERLAISLRKCLFKVLSVGPIPRHIAFIMEGNRRYAKKINSAEGVGHKAGHSSLVSLLTFCYGMGVKYVTVYAFSIENFKRRPEEVRSLMDLIRDKTEELLEPQGIVSEYETRVYFVGDLKLLEEPVRLAAEKAMEATAGNTKTALLICVAYTSTDEIVHAIQEACKEKSAEVETLIPRTVSDASSEGTINKETKPLTGNMITGLGDYRVKEPRDERLFGRCYEEKQKLPIIKLADIERHMYMAVAPDPDILIRSSGETRLSNFLLWQTTHCPLYSPAALWPEMGLWHLVWAVLNFQRSYKNLEKKKKKV